MSKKLIYFTSFIFVLGLVGSASAELVAHWKFDEGSGDTAFDSSGNNYHGIFFNDPVWVEGMFGGALNLEDGGYLAIQEMHYEGSGFPEVSVCAWIRTSSAGNQFIVSFDRNEYYRLSIATSAGVDEGEVGWHMQTDASGILDYSSETRVDDGQWHHVCGVYDNGIATIYIDGEPEPSVTSGTTFGRGTLRYGFIGKNSEATGFNEPAPTGNPVDGDIDDVRIYDHALSEEEIKELAGRPTSYKPDPANGAKYSDTWASLSWIPGMYAVSHDVYIGDNFDDVNNGAESTFQGNQTFASHIIGFPGYAFPDGLSPGTTYYWRIDDVDANGAKIKGDVWSFWVPSITAYEPVPADGEVFEDPNVELTWSLGLNATMHAVYFGTNADEVTNAAGGLPHMETTFNPGLLSTETTYYWRVDTFNGAEWVTGPLWTFTTRPLIPPPSDPNLILLYKFNEGAGTNAIDWSGHGNHGKLFGPQWLDYGWIGDGALNFIPADMPYVAISNLHYTDANNPEVTVCAWIRTSDPNSQVIISFDRSDFWRLQINGEVATDGQVGWHVMTNSGDQQVDYGSLTRVDDGFWHHVCGVFDNGISTIYIDGLPEPPAFGGPTFGDELTRYGYVGTGSEADVFNGIPRTPADHFNGDIDEVRIYNKALTQDEIINVMRIDLLMAWDLQPPTRTFDIEDVPSSLTWKAGDDASQHDVYFGTDLDAVNNADASDTSGVYRGRQSGTTYVPTDDFVLGQSYLWRIDEVNSDGTITKGGVRAIIIPDFVTIDDFEAYNDLNPEDPESNRIFNAWIDGYDDPTNGSLVGYEEPPFAEQTIVNGGRQSMPLYYDNSVGYSEATLTLTGLRDWTKHNLAELSLWFYGNASNAAEPMYVALNGSAVVSNDNPNAALVEEWTEWKIDLQSFGVNLASINTIAIGLGNKNNPQAGGSGTIYIDDIRLYQPPPPPEPVTIENFSFELPGTEKQLGFDNVPGWNTDAPPADSGVETGYTPTDGDWTAYLMSGDPSVWQLTDHTIAEGDVFEMKVDARITWAATNVQMTLYYDDNGTRVPVVSSDVALTEDMQEYTLSFTTNDVPESVGHQIGIEFTNVSSGDSWIGLDNVRLEVSTE